ncbi:MAG TPA: family 1 glycosylhydrolase [Gemmatimonadaceae bacterium]|jgi:beta-glucosidase|nr:family 1 glycosylhydrolase [Gemmatimonadaceae bacterium]
MTFLFASGIENSYPTNATGNRIDQMDRCGHYARWEEDFALARELGLDALRYGPAYYRTHTAPDRFDWESADEPMARLRELGLEVIADLCHFGVPTWLGGFQDPAFPVLFAEYARAFARRYPWVRYFTPIHQIFVCASFSGLHGVWNECQAGDASFVRALRNLCMAHELAVEAIVAERPHAIIVQGESMEHFHPAGETAAHEAQRLNGLKLLSLDLTLGHELNPGMAGYLHRHGVTSNDLRFFREQRFHAQRWIGLGYSPTCEHRVAASGRQTTARQTIGFRRLAADYHRRYGLPLFHYQTSRSNRLATAWLTDQWRDVLALRSTGVPITGFTWSPLTDPVDEYNDVHPIGLYDLKRRIRPVAQAHQALIARWKPVLAVVAELELHAKVLRA